MSGNTETNFFLGATLDFDGNNPSQSGGNVKKGTWWADTSQHLYQPIFLQTTDRQDRDPDANSLLPALAFDLYSATSITYWRREVTHPAFYHPPLAPFFFFCCCFFLVAGAPAGFWCLGGMTLLVADTAAPLPGRGEVGGLLAVLLASLQEDKRKRHRVGSQPPARCGTNAGSWQCKAAAAPLGSITYGRTLMQGDLKQASTYRRSWWRMGTYLKGQQSPSNWCSLDSVSPWQWKQG